MDQLAQIEKALRSLRQNGAALPEIGLIDTRPISVPVIPEDALETSISSLDLSEDSLGEKGFNLAVDLDDTLLFGSQTCPEIWELGKGYRDPDIRNGFLYQEIPQTFKGRIARRFGRPEYHCVDASAHESLKAPRVIVAPNLPLLSVLIWLKKKGAKIGLATASAQERVDYLFQRLPIFADLFGNRVMSAQDLARRSVEAVNDPDLANLPHYSASKAVHTARPFSIMTKTPWALSPIFDDAPYDEDQVRTYWTALSGVRP